MRVRDIPRAMASETSLVRACLNVLALHRVMAWRNNTGGFYAPSRRFIRFGKIGSSDIFSILPGGTFLAIEAKRPDGRLSPAQAEFLRQVRDAGGYALLITDAAALERWLVAGETGQTSRTGCVSR